MISYLRKKHLHAAGGADEMKNQTRGSTLEPRASSETYSRRRLINILNYVSYKDGEVAVNLRNPDNRRKVSLRAKPEPCMGDKVRLTWSEKPPKSVEFTDHEFVEFLIDKGSRVVLVDGQAADVDRSGITVLLPERCYASSRRRIERFNSAFVRATITYHGSEVSGVLQDFGGGYVKVRCSGRGLGSSFAKNRKSPLHIVLANRNATVYEGNGLIKRLVKDGENLDLVIALTASPNDKPIERQEVALSRNLVAFCRHPLSDRIIRLNVVEASYNSFVVRERPEHAALFCGLILPEVRIDLGTGEYAKCAVQVAEDKKGTWLMVILDMPILDQRKLFSFMEKEAGMSSGVSKVIDPDELIEFFFEVGFIYPKKYASLTKSKENLKQILSRLYIDTPSIAQHFVRYNEDSIEAHIAMVRFYERSWVVHHHSAIGGMGAGSAVLMQIFRYIHSYSAFPSTNMDYVMTYYRPENRFPDRVLGGIARSLKQPSLCSIDPFAYLHLQLDKSDSNKPANKKWQLTPASQDDLRQLEVFYQTVSGGSTITAFGISTTSRKQEAADLDAEFQKAGLHRRKEFFSLRKDGALKAVIMALDSDDGLNMSNLLKSLHVFVIDSKDLPFAQLMKQLKRFSSFYQEQEIPVLLFPPAYVEGQGISPEKVYNLLVFHVSVGKLFIEFVERMTKRTIRRQYNGVSSDQEGDTSGRP